MISEADYNRLTLVLPMLRTSYPQLEREFRQAAVLSRIPAGTDVFAEGDPAHSVALLLSEVVRVYKISATGREITLYRFGLGESCILTASAVLNQQSFPAFATVEEDAEAVIVPAEDFREWVRRYDLWREFVFDLLSQRLAGVLEILDDVTFRRMDARVAAFLADHGRRSNPVHTTHQAIADDLGSSREVVSRILEGFVGLELIRSARGVVEVLDFPSLQRISRT